jgi:hypothetical protein
MPLRDPGMPIRCTMQYLYFGHAVFVHRFRDTVECIVQSCYMHKELLGTLSLVSNFRKLTEIQPFEAGCDYSGTSTLLTCTLSTLEY